MQKPQVLVVEDMDAMAMLLSDILTDEGYDVLLRSTIIEDADEVGRLRPAVIVLDYIINQTNGGFTMVHHLKNNPLTAQIPIVVCTAAAKEIDEIEPFLTDHQIDVVLKPFEIDTFVNTVRQAVTRHNALNG